MTARLIAFFSAFALLFSVPVYAYELPDEFSFLTVKDSDSGIMPVAVYPDGITYQTSNFSFSDLVHLDPSSYSSTSWLLSGNGYNYYTEGGYSVTSSNLLNFIPVGVNETAYVGSPFSSADVCVFAGDVYFKINVFDNYLSSNFYGRNVLNGTARYYSIFNRSNHNFACFLPGRLSSATRPNSFWSGKLAQLPDVSYSFGGISFNKVFWTVPNVNQYESTSTFYIGGGPIRFSMASSQILPSGTYSVNVYLFDSLDSDMSDRLSVLDNNGNRISSSVTKVGSVLNGTAYQHCYNILFTLSRDLPLEFLNFLFSYNCFGYYVDLGSVFYTPPSSGGGGSEGGGSGSSGSVDYSGDLNNLNNSLARGFNQNHSDLGKVNDNLGSLNSNITSQTSQLQQSINSAAGSVSGAVSDAGSQVSSAVSNAADNINKTNQSIAASQEAAEQQRHHDTLYGYDTSEDTAKQESAASEIEAYEDMEDQIIDSVSATLESFELQSPDTVITGELAGAFIQVSDWFQLLYDSSGMFHVILIVGLSLGVALMIIGFYRVQNGG